MKNERQDIIYSCFHCFSYIEQEEITEFWDEGQTPVCPLCRIDALIQGKHSQEELQRIHRGAFL